MGQISKPKAHYTADLEKPVYKNDFAVKPSPERVRERGSA